MKTFKQFSDCISEKKEKNPKEYDYEGEMTKNDMHIIMLYAQRIAGMLEDNSNMPEWCQSKIAIAKDYLQTVSDYLTTEMKEDYQIDICEAAEAGLTSKAKKSGISIGTLRKVYRRGVAAWNSGHRPGTTPQQWGMARVNSYITKGKGTYYGADKDLNEGDTSKLPRVAKDKKSGLPKKYVAGLSPNTAKARAAHWEKANKMSDRDSRAYEPAPGDTNAKTKESKHTKKYRAMFGEGMNEETYQAVWSENIQIGITN